LLSNNAQFGERVKFPQFLSTLFEAFSAGFKYLNSCT